MHELITVVSTADLEQHPRNTRTSFTNVLVETFRPILGKRISVKLRSIILSHGLTTLDENSADNAIHTPESTVKIHVGEIEPQLNSARPSDKCLGQFSLAKCDRHGSYSFYEFENTAFYKLSAAPLTQISIRLTDVYDRPLILAFGGPTFIMLEFDDERLSEQFQVTSFSHPTGSRGEELDELFPLNTLHKFTSTLASMISLGEDWEVAMTSLTFPPGMTNSTVWMRIGGVHKPKMYFHPGRSHSLRGLCNETQLFLEKAGYSDELRVRVRNSEDVYEEDDNSSVEKVFIQRRPISQKETEEESARRKRVIRVTLSAGYMSLFGHERVNLSQNLTKGDHLELPVVHAHLRPFDVPSPVSMLYCSAVRPSVVGDTKGPLLQIVPVTDHLNSPNITFYEPKHLIFHPVSNQPIKNLDFEFREIDGKLCRFSAQENDHGVMICLMFRRRSAVVDSYPT